MIKRDVEYTALIAYCQSYKKARMDKAVQHSTKKFWLLEI